jgi:hypothetical protein
LQGPFLFVLVMWGGCAALVRGVKCVAGMELIWNSYGVHMEFIWSSYAGDRRNSDCYPTLNIEVLPRRGISELKCPK